MTLDEEKDFASEGGLVSGERALNDVALSIGFSMMVLLFVVISSMTALQRITVNLPQTDRASTTEKSEEKTPVAVTLEADEEGLLKAVYGDGKELDMSAPLGPRLKDLYGDNIASAGAVSLQVYADGSLSHRTVSETVFRLNSAFRSLKGVRKVTTRYVALEAD